MKLQEVPFLSTYFFLIIFMLRLRMLPGPILGRCQGARLLDCAIFIHLEIFYNVHIVCHVLNRHLPQSGDNGLYYVCMHIFFLFSSKNVLSPPEQKTNPAIGTDIQQRRRRRQKLLSFTGVMEDRVMGLQAELRKAQ